jgi:endonuclease V-like protein UPF0215 family
MKRHRLSNVIGFDDAPFGRDDRGKVKIVGAVYANLRFDGVLIGEVEKDGDDAAMALAALVNQSRFAEHAQLIMLQGITMAGFNVVDVFALHKALELPILVVARRQPDLKSIQYALNTHIQNGKDKWNLIKTLGPMEQAGSVSVQRVGLDLDHAVEIVEHFSVHSHIPEPLRTAHLIAGALVNGQSRGNP